MRLFGLEICTVKSAEDQAMREASRAAGIITDLRLSLGDVVADRDAANKQIERLLHNGTELPILWAAIRQAGHEKQVRHVYERLSGGKL